MASIERYSSGLIVVQRQQTDAPTVERRIAGLEAALSRLQSALARQRELTGIWHARYQMVKTENNALRRRVKNGSRDADRVSTDSENVP